MSNKLNEEKRKLALQIRLLEDEAKKIEEQIFELENRKLELDVVQMSLSEIKNEKKDDILIPVGSGVFVEGKVADKDSVLINVGSNVIVRKSAKTAGAYLSEQSAEISRLQDRLRADLNLFVKQIQDLLPEM